MLYKRFLCSIFQSSSEGNNPEVCRPVDSDVLLNLHKDIRPPPIAAPEEFSPEDSHADAEIDTGQVSSPGKPIKYRDLSSYDGANENR